MSNITHEGVAKNLGVFGEFNAAGMTQPEGSNQCGAYAVLAAIAAIQNCHLPKTFTVMGNPITIKTNDRFLDTCNTIYELTGILNPARLTDPKAPEDVDSGGYNSPTAMASVATGLNLKVTLNLTQDAYDKFSAIYPSEFANWKKYQTDSPLQICGGTSDIPLYQTASNKETQILCVNTGAGLHWIARGSDGNYYDPANGSIDNAWGDPIPLNPVSTYTWVGIYMVLSS